MTRLPGYPGFPRAWRGPLAAITLLWAALTGWPAETPPPAVLAPLETIGAVRRLTPERFREAVPVRIQGTVTFAAPSSSDYVDGFLHDGREGLYFTGLASAAPRFRVGDQIEVEGTAVRGGFAPMVWFQRVSPLGTNALPEPRRAPLGQLLTQPDDSNWVEISGTIQVAVDHPDRWTVMVLEANGNLMVAQAPTECLQSLGTNRSGSVLRLRGVASGIFSPQRRAVGLRLFVPNRESVEVLRLAPAEPTDRPIVPISSLFGFAPDRPPQERFSVTGVVTALRSHSEYFVQDASGGLLVRQNLIPISPHVAPEPGDQLTLSGRLELAGFQPVMVLSQVSKQGRSPLPPARMATPEELTSSAASGLRVELEAVVYYQRRSIPGVPGLVSCVASNVAFQVLKSPAQPTLPDLPSGTRIRVRGTCLHVSPNAIFRAEPSLELHLARTEDLEVISYPFVWTARRVGLFGGGLAITSALALGWGFTLRHQVRARTRELQQLNDILRSETNAQQADLATTANALRQSEERLSLVMDASEDGFYDLDCRTGKCFFGKAWMPMLGYQSDEMPFEVGTWEKLLHPADRTRVLAETGRILTGEIPRFEMEYRMRHRDGSSVWVLDRGQVVSRDENGVPIRIVGSHTNVTRLHHLTVLLSLVLEAGQIGFWDGTVKEQTQTWGGHWSTLLGYQPEEMPRTNAGFVDLIHPEDRANVWNHYVQFLAQSENSFEIEFRVRAREGSWHWVFARARVVERDDQGKATRVIGIHLDADRRKLVEGLLQQQAAELAESNAALRQAAQSQSEFLANMSHELRTPLTSILALCEVLLETVYGPVNPRQADPIRSIEKSGRHLQELINEVLDVAQLDAGRTELVLQPCLASTMVEAVANLIEGQALRKRVTLETVPGTTDIEVQADPLRLKQILVNLVGNAVKFTPQGGRVTVRVEATLQTVCFRVIDTGIGIPAEKLQEIFEPFVQLDTGLNRKHGGSGLGLVIAKRFTELQGGILEVASTVGQGSCFSVTLPRANHRSGGPLPGPTPDHGPANGQASQGQHTRKGPAARAFGGGQGGEAGASPQFGDDGRRTEPTLVTGQMAR